MDKVTTDTWIHVLAAPSGVTCQPWLLHGLTWNRIRRWGNHALQSDIIMSVMASQITSLAIYLLNSLFRYRSHKISKLRVTGLCEGNSPVAGEFPAQRTSNAKNISIWWRHHGKPNSCPDANFAVIYSSLFIHIFRTHFTAARLLHYSDVTWASWHLKSLATRSFMQ